MGACVLRAINQVSGPLHFAVAVVACRAVPGAAICRMENPVGHPTCKEARRWLRDPALPIPHNEVRGEQ